jgi:two-component system sensor histidine kinase KdpD
MVFLNDQDKSMIIFKQFLKYSILMPLAITLLGLTPFNILTIPSVLLLYMLVVLYTALYCERFIVLLTALSALVQFIFVFIEPRFSLASTNLAGIFDGFLFVAFAVIVGNIAGKLQRNVKELQYQRDFLRAHLALRQELSTAQDSKIIISLVQKHFEELFGGNVNFALKPRSEDIKQAHSFKEELIWTVNAFSSLTSDQTAMLLTVQEAVHQELTKRSSAVALLQAERISNEEKLRSALLSSVSHDLKSPLVTMLGAATSLRDLRNDLTGDDADELVECIISESQRLESYIQNLLDMTKLGDHGLTLSRDWISFEEIFHVVSRRIHRIAPHFELRLQIENCLPSLNIHAALIEQALYNITENALKVTPDGLEVLVKVGLVSDVLEVRICDHGPGLPKSEWNSVFDPFYTFSLGDCYEKGTGLGLSICRSILRVHGGEARIETAPKGYSHCVLLTLPISGALMSEIEE